MGVPTAMESRTTWRLTCLIAALLTLLFGCRQRRSDEFALRIAVLPIVDALPLYVAEAEGLFAAEGVNITLVPAASAAERDQLLQAGQIDGMITDLVALVLYNRDGASVTAVRYAMLPTSEMPQFRILASAASGIAGPEDLRGVPVGISEGTVIEYVTQRLLQAAGLQQSEIVTIAVPRIPERMALLEAGSLTAATLPEPLGSLAMLQGAVPILDDTTQPGVSSSLYALRTDVIASHPDLIPRYVRAIERAVDMINADKGRWSALIAEAGLVPVSLQGSYRLPDYPESSVPTAVQFADVAAWLEETGRVDSASAYEECITSAYTED